MTTLTAEPDRGGTVLFLSLRTTIPYQLLRGESSNLDSIAQRPEGDKPAPVTELNTDHLILHPHRIHTLIMDEPKHHHHRKIKARALLPSHHTDTGSGTGIYSTTGSATLLVLPTTTTTS